ncbi:MAG: hypothetical protein IID03_08905 [Candidatus Dadabacteria bacterium]|nr:hypothetical protein [Candidatus Dadabacteria bacterium]
MSEQVLRFGITDGNGHRAATWKLWTPPNKSDVYLSCRELRGALKASLHQSGQWHIAYSQETFEEVVKDAIPAKHNRFIKTWTKPKNIATGITLAIRIVIPHSAVTSPISDKESDINWIPNCTKPYATEIDIMIISPSTPVTGWPGKNKMGTKPIGSYQIANDETVWAVYQVVDMPDLTPVTKGKGSFYKGRSYNDLKSGKLRALVLGKEQDGSRVLYDCAVIGKN